MPVDPIPGNMVLFVDYAGTWATNNLTINPNDNLIQGLSTYVLTVSRTAVGLVYIDKKQGWLFFAP
jgi:hypothetical protein